MGMSTSGDVNKTDFSPLPEQYDINADGLAAMSIKSWDIGMAVKPITGSSRMPFRPSPNR